MRKNVSVTRRERPQRRSDRPPATKEIHLAKTKRRPRVITVDGTAWGTLNAAPLHLAHDFVFASEMGAPFANFASRFVQIRKCAKTKFRCHDLRHEFAIRWLERGGDIHDLSRHLGHSSVKVTEMYLDYVGESGGTYAGTAKAVWRKAPCWLSR